MKRVHQLAVGLIGILVAAGVAEAQVVTRGPYLQMPTTSSVIVRWRTDVATDSRVSYGAAVGSLTANVDDATLTTEHIVTVSGLTADTKYFYAVGTTSGPLEGDDSDHFFRAHPPVGPARAMRIWVTGDGGFANANGQAVRDAFATYNTGNVTDFWLLLGDNAYPSGTDSEYQAALFDMHHDMLRNVAVWSVYGNHEEIAANDVTETGPYFDLFTFPTAAQSGGVASGSEAYYSFDYANVHFIILNSETPAAGAGNPLPTAPMMVWLEADLQATTADWVIALWHRPPYSKGLFHDSDAEQNEINMRQNVLPTLEDYGVDLVLTGHSHSYERSYLIDNHYGLSGTFTSANQLDSGDGDPAGDGAYRKGTIGLAPHEGEVHAVCGSSSEVRNATLNHPAHKVGLLELGSMVIDIDDNVLTARFLNSSVAVTDEFRIVKGPACAPAPLPGCAGAPEGKITVKKYPSDSSKDKIIWKWKGGTLLASDVPSPATQTDVAVCFYDADGTLAGGLLPKGALWEANGQGDWQYKDQTLQAFGTLKTKIKFSKPFIKHLGKGSGLGLPPALSLTTPVTGQLVNLDNGECFESVFATAKKNTAEKFVAKIP